MRILISLFLYAGVLLGVELEPGRHYIGPEKLTVSYLGVSMGVPRHWEATAKEGEGLLLYQQGTKDTMVLRSRNFTPNEALAYLNSPHYIHRTTKIFPSEEIVRVSSRIFSRVYTASGGNGRPAYLIYIVLGPQERAAVMKVQYDRSHESAIKVIGMNIVQTLSFTPTRQLRNALKDLNMRLKGMHLAYLKRDGAYDEKHELWLCSDGVFRLQKERTVAGGMSRVHEQQQGRWSIEDEELLLQGEDGVDRHISIQFQDNALIFDGYRIYELQNHLCQ